MFPLFVKTDHLLTARYSSRTRTSLGIFGNNYSEPLGERKFMRKHAGCPKFAEASNSGFKVSDPDFD